MRTTLSIDDDILAAAKALAVREKRSIGEVISSWSRQALQRPEGTASKRNGVPLLPGRSDATPVTSEVVNRLRDEGP